MTPESSPHTWTKCGCTDTVFPGMIVVFWDDGEVKVRIRQVCGSYSVALVNTFQHSLHCQHVKGSNYRTIWTEINQECVSFPPSFSEPENNRRKTPDFPLLGEPWKWHFHQEFLQLWLECSWDDRTASSIPLNRERWKQTAVCTVANQPAHPAVNWTYALTLCVMLWERPYMYLLCHGNDARPEPSLPLHESDYPPVQPMERCQRGVA